MFSIIQFLCSGNKDAKSMASESVSLPTCAKCGIKAPKPSTKFCTKCGAKLEPTPVKLERPKCININCNKELEPDDEYCDECGTNQKHADQTSTSFKNNATGGNLNEVDPGNREPHKGDNEIDNRLVFSIIRGCIDR